MKFLKSYKIFETDGTYMYNPIIEKNLPNMIKVVKGNPKNPEKLIFKKSISRHIGPEVQIPYETMDKRAGRTAPDTFEIDIYWNYDENIGGLSINVEMNFGELTACQFRITPKNKVDVIRYTSLHSKDDTSNTIFAIDDESIKSLCNYFNSWDNSFNITPEDLKFMDSYDNYSPD